MNAISKDRILEYTTIGIHKDDLILEMNDFPVKSLGSQGQQKSYLVALKLAKFDYIKRKAGFSPILLLDDIFDKFDADRVEQIITACWESPVWTDFYNRYSSEQIT